MPDDFYCEFDCGNLATYQLKNGKYCCSKNFQSCPNMRIKNGLSKKGKMPNFPNGRNLSVESRLKMAVNKNKNKFNDDRIKRQVETRIRKIKEGMIKPSFSGKKHTEESKRKISLAMSKNHNGGYKKVPYYDYILKDGTSIKLRGTYEVRFAKILDERNIEWNYQNSILYKNEEENERYILPDFYIPEYDSYFDTKGYFTDDCKKKLKLVSEQTGININLIFEKDLSEIEKGKDIKEFCRGKSAGSPEVS